MDINQLRIKALRQVMGQLSQKDFADLHGLDASYLSQLLNGHRKLGEKAAANLETKIGLKSGTLVAPQLTDTQGREDRTNKESNVIAADFSQPRLRQGEISIPLYDVKAAMGSGQLPADYVETVRNIVVQEAYLRGQGVSYTHASNLSVITGFGQSMEGTFSDGDPIVVDRGVSEFVGDGIYVFTWDNLLYIKRLQKDSPGTFDMISDNPKHKDKIIHIVDVTIHARVLLAWNARKL
ncbi:XRE family transcriptional regulator [Pseudomonas alliivorans]|uniref:XRE family transcriptional regulator n=1 Tax=Pseudomonas alliivorans TaxID=2810613 RepID=UPI001AE79F98|nr:XRE family transcriptional regulator [Pseudomonas alliivorans]MBP0943114.1 helix-turn-helix transcriptional regulator [Pseudomonas alliivorans]MEE4881210.1 XRE family transcriptional regulator [Pseudomonas alliivorans]MEE4932514.1 XRE family transcriptional regulator [Pseudomonas alliivorans]MEE4937977.1 XRE family transcriptional regulator [Pseudomonas alliivorans]MEE4943090.1 XRE family transcriptional regulator [Pseudomonas alliivorans]